MVFSEIKPFVRYARYMRMDGSWEFVPHIPYDARLFFVQEGSGEIGMYDGKVFKMEKGCALIINSGMEYHIKTPQDKVTYIIFNFDYTYAHSMEKNLVHPGKRHNYQPKKIVEHIEFQDFKLLNNYAYIQNIDSVRKNAVKAVEEYEWKKIGYELKTSCLLAEILIEALRKSEAGAAARGDMSDKIINYIHRNYSLPLTNIGIGQEFNMHPNHISRLIKQATGVPLHKYILEVRLLRAVELLEIGTYGIGEIAGMCGFCDVYYFSRYFKSVMKMTPSEYLNK